MFCTTVSTGDPQASQAETRRSCGFHQVMGHRLTIPTVVAACEKTVESIQKLSTQGNGLGVAGSQQCTEFLPTPPTLHRLAFFGERLHSLRKKDTIRRGRDFRHKPSWTIRASLEIASSFRLTSGVCVCYVGLVWARQTSYLRIFVL